MLCQTAALLALAATGCGGDNSVSREPDVPADKCVLMLSTGIIERSRAGAATADNDKMHTLRVVVVRPDGTVEHNDYVNFGQSPQTECYRIYEVVPNEQKTIYLIANEGGAAEDLTRQLDNFSQAAVEGLTFTLGSGPVPMSSKYVLTSPPAGQFQEKEMNIVRAATKISYRFINYRTSKITVNSVGVSRTANCMYLMPRVGESDQMKVFDGASMPWIDWLRKVSDESQVNLQYPGPTNPGLHDPGLADKRGWILNYDVPSSAVYGVEQLTMNLALPADMGEGAKPVVSDEFYMHESRFGAAADGTQTYTMAFNLTEFKRLDGLDDDGKPQYETAGSPVSMDGIKFENLKALFRNTHVLVDVEISSEIFVRVIPYAECRLDPIFGLDPK